MIKFKEIQGLQLENTANLQKIERTDEGRAIGHIPGWKYLIDPSYANGVEVRNRCIANSKSIASRAVTTVISDSNKLFNITNEALRIDCDKNVSINASEYSMFAVLSVTESTSARPLWVFRGNTTSTESNSVENVPNLAISSNGGQLSVFSKIIDNSYDGMVAAGLRLATFPLNRNIKSSPGLSLILLSFSEGLGFTASQDGETLGNIQSSATLRNELNNFSSFREIRGTAGMCGILDIDLHKAKNTTYRKQLEQFLMKKYNLT